MRIIFTFSAKDKKKSKNCGLIPTSKKFQQTRLATFDVLSWNELFLVPDCVTEAEDELEEPEDDELEADEESDSSKFFWAVAVFLALAFVLLLVFRVLIKTNPI